MTDAPLRQTPLVALHRELGAKLVPFAGYEMPVQYPMGILNEHLHCRAAAGLFDVSHMGQVTLTGAGPAAALETLVCGDMQSLAEARTRYTLFTDENGGILDDLMVTNRARDFFLVVNAGCKADDIAHMKRALEPRIAVREHAGRGLLALQGPKAAAVMARLAPAATTMSFMSYAEHRLLGIECWLTRSGYTGEDGWEISVPASEADKLARGLLAEPEVKPIGLGARDSLRLEAGLCLYGHDIDRSTTPVEAGLSWAIGKRRRGGGGFPGAAKILDQLAKGPARSRVGLVPEGRVVAREHTPILDAAGVRIGEITSGGFGPSFGGPIAMGYVDAAAAREGTPIGLLVRDAARPARVVKLPFVAPRYHRG